LGVDFESDYGLVRHEALMVRDVRDNPGDRMPRVLAISLSALLLWSSTMLMACVAARQPAGGVPRPGAFALPSHVRIRVGDRVTSVPLETYVVGTALSEFSPVGETDDTARRILEMQSVISRTYATSHLGRHAAEGFDLCDTTHCQVYQPSRITTSRFSATAQAAAHATAGRILLFDQRPAETLFHADCGGHTADASDVWGGAPVPYLRGTDDDVPAGTHRQWQFTAELPALLSALNGDSRSAVGRSLDGIEVTRRDESGRAAELLLRGETSRRIRGDQLRAVLNGAFGVRSIMSTRLAVRREAGGYRFEGTGFGHGVGLCQVGAAARARQGRGLEHILGAYYPGSRLSR
jgi:stage II sporulation protein D